MSEPIHTSETPATGAPVAAPVVSPADTPPATPPVEPKPTETVDYWKQMSRKNEEQAKANAEAAKKLKDIQDRDLSELQRAQRDAEELRTQFEVLNRTNLRNQVALQKGLPADVAAILSGSTEEELTAHADALLAWRGSATPTTPRPDPGQGPRPASPEADEDALFKQFYPDPPTR